MSHKTRIRKHAAFLVVIATLTFALLPAVAAQQPQQPAGPMAPEKYKNIQVLTNVPADQLELTMRYVSAAVGMQCVSCHVQDSATGEFAYEKDDKRNKQTARTMMKMVNAINAGNFGIQAACATCHAGRNEPAGLQLAEPYTADQISQMNAAAGRGGQPPAGGPGGRRAQPPAPPVDDILSKYFEAVGGRAALEKAQTLAMSGSLTTRAGQTIPFTVEEKSGKYRETQQTRPETTTRAFDGKAGWIQTGAKSADLSGFPLDQVLRTNDLGAVLKIKDKYPTLQASGRPFPINGKDSIAVTGRAGVTTEQFYFDAATGLLVRRVVTTRTPLGSLREQIDYGDYRTTGGIKVPFEIKRTNWDTLDTFKATDVKVNAPIDDARFARPR